MKTLYLCLRHKMRHAHFMEVWTDEPRITDLILLAKEVQTLEEINEGLKMLDAKPLS